jgi:hypothetical protein
MPRLAGERVLSRRFVVLAGAATLCGCGAQHALPEPPAAQVNEARRAIDNMEQAMVEEAAGMGALHDRGWATDAAPHRTSPAGTRQVVVVRPPDHDR